jgi:large subunit ribosomal protein L9
MATHVQVVLRSDVESLGVSGELVRVRPGYARNYLLPRGLASVATRANIKQIEHEKEGALRRAEKARKEQEELADKLRKVVVMIAKEVGEEGRLFGSVTTADIAASLESKGYDIDKKRIVLPEEPIKSVGTYEVSVKFGAGVSAKLKLEVKTAS